MLEMEKVVAATWRNEKRYKYALHPITAIKLPGEELLAVLLSHPHPLLQGQSHKLQQAQNHKIK